MKNTRAGYFKSVSALCKAYNLHRNTFAKYRLKPGFPERTGDGWEGASVMKFIKETSTVAGQNSTDVAALRGRKLVAEINLKELEYKKKSEELIEKELCRVHIRRMRDLFEHCITKTINEGSSLIAGMDKVNARSFLEKWFDEIRGKMKQEISEWKELIETKSS